MSWNDATLRTRFLRKDGKVVSGEEALKGKRLIGVYCSAHWCPPCRAFTPVLADFYKKYKQVDPNFEIIFCSSDRTEADMLNYFKSAHGDYLCYEFNSPANKAMQKIVSCKGIPTLAIFMPDGTLVTQDGRSRVAAGADSVARNGFGNEKKMAQASGAGGAFQGQGRSLGGGGGSAPAAQPAASSAAPAAQIKVDEGKETTTLQLAFPDGTKLPVKFNTDHHRRREGPGAVAAGPDGPGVLLAPRRVPVDRTHQPLPHAESCGLAPLAGRRADELSLRCRRQVGLTAQNAIEEDE
ncbi:putative nucleoredoxin 1 [Diplonema papillatum]|nr:putative nucleoredoxin 1 [Diplonema papillatum]